jgi:hypothetical protein
MSRYRSKSALVSVLRSTMERDGIDPNDVAWTRLADGELFGDATYGWTLADPDLSVFDLAVKYARKGRTINAPEPPMTAERAGNIALALRQDQGWSHETLDGLVWDYVMDHPDNEVRAGLIAHLRRVQADEDGA